MGALALGEGADLVDGDSGPVGSTQRHAGSELAGVQPLLFALHPEGVGGGGDKRGGAVFGGDGEVDEVLVVLGDDGGDDLTGGCLTGLGIGDDDLVTYLDVFDALGGAAEVERVG